MGSKLKIKSVTRNLYWKWVQWEGPGVDRRPRPRCPGDAAQGRRGPRVGGGAPLPFSLVFAAEAERSTCDSYMVCLQHVCSFQFWSFLWPLAFRRPSTGIDRADLAELPTGTWCDLRLRLRLTSIYTALPDASGSWEHSLWCTKSVEVS